MARLENNLGAYYELPEEIMKDKYRGCGNGRIIVAIDTGEVLDFDYMDEEDQVVDEQDLYMHPDAGEVLGFSMTTITYRANFSCGHACLF